MDTKKFIQFDFFPAGLGISKFLGTKGSFAKAVGIDIHSNPGILKAQQSLKKDSGDIVDQLVMCSVHTSAGHSYHFGEAGKIFKRTSGGTWSLLDTVTATPKIVGAAEHSDGYVYFTYVNKVGKIQVSDDAITEAAHTLTNSNSNYGQVFYHEKQNAIFIANKELVARVDAASAFSANAFDLKGTYEIRDIASRDIDVLIGATLDSGSASRFFQWDGVKSSWQYSWVFGDEIKWMLNKGERVYILGGENGEIYDFDDIKDPIKKIPGDYSNVNTLTSNPNAKCLLKGLLHFGIQDASTGNAFPNGIYTLGSKDLEVFPLALNCEYPISAGDLDGVEIGAVSTDGSTLFVSWKDKAGTGYGVDVIDTANKYASAYVEFLVMKVDEVSKKNFDRFPCNFEPLPASCSLHVKRSLDLASSFTSVATFNIAGETNDEGTFDGENVPDAYMIQLRIDLVTNVNNSPGIVGLGIVYQTQEMD